MDATGGFITMAGDRVHRSTATYIFPTLKLSEILQCLEELEIPISKQELTEPSRHRDKLRQMWIRVVSV